MKHISAISVQDLSDYINSNVRDGVINGESLLDRVGVWEGTSGFGYPFRYNNSTSPKTVFLSPAQCAMVATTLNKRIQVSVVNKLVSMLRRYDNQYVEDGMLITSMQLLEYINLEFNMTLENHDIQLLLQDFFKVDGFGSVKSIEYAMTPDHNLLYDHELTRTQVITLAGSVSIEAQAHVINDLHLLELRWDKGNVYQDEITEAIRAMKVYQETKVSPHNGHKIEEFDVSTGEMKFYFRPNKYINTLFQDDTSELVITTE